MRKRVLGLAVCFAAFVVSAAAQNTFPASGNVGIGTTDPAALVHIQGINNSVALTLRNGSSPSPLQWCGGGNCTYEMLTPASGNLYLGSDLNGIVNGLVIQQNGNTGVGTTIPATKLHVSGVGELLRVDDAGSSNVRLSIGTTNNGSNQYGWIQEYQDNTGVAGISPIAINPLGGNVGIGTTSPGAKLEVDGSLKLTTNSGASITFQDGTVQSTAYTGVTCGGDYAESVDVTGGRTNYEPGDLLVIDPSAPGKFLKSDEAYSTLVAGIYSTKPGTVGRRETTYAKNNTTEVPMAMMGIVPTKVSAENGPIKTGDLLVTSSAMGYAMKGTDRSRLTGAVVGKALGSLNSGTGVIEVLVTLQ